MEDIITQLPDELLGLIMSKVPLCDAVRTSVLSKAWRYTWTLRTNITFDDLFCRDMAERRNEMPFPNIVDQILLLHGGPVFEFVTYVPALPKHQLDMDRWIRFVSKLGVSRLVLANMISITAYRIPDIIFSCKTLEHLTVRHGMLKPPPSFVGFQHLETLHLMNISCNVNVSSNLLVDAVQLKHLVFDHCSGIDEMDIKAPKLTYFYVYKSYGVNWSWFEHVPKVESLQIRVPKDVDIINQPNRMDVLKFVTNLSKVCTLILDGFSIKSLAPDNAPTMPPRCFVPNLKTLGLSGLVISDLDHISCLLHLLKCSPSLETFCVTVDDSIEYAAELPVVGWLEDWLRSVEWNALKLDALKKVTLSMYQCHAVEAYIFRVLLASSKSLEKMYVNLSPKCNKSQALKLKKDSAKFNRASEEVAIEITSNPTST